jgi:hypothetical protein
MLDPDEIGGASSTLGDCAMADAAMSKAGSANALPSHCRPPLNRYCFCSATV